MHDIFQLARHDVEYSAPSWALLPFILSMASAMVEHAWIMAILLQHTKPIAIKIDWCNWSSDRACGSLGSARPEIYRFSGFQGERILPSCWRLLQIMLVQSVRNRCSIGPESLLNHAGINVQSRRFCCSFWVAYENVSVGTSFSPSVFADRVGCIPSIYDIGNQVTVFFVIGDIHLLFLLQLLNIL